MAEPNAIALNAILCDTATTAEGKLYMHGGGWNSMTATTFPCTHPRIGIGAVLDIPYTFTNAVHRLEISIQDQDGTLLELGRKAGADGEIEVLHRMEAVFNIGRPPLVQAGDSQTIALAINLDQIRFDAPGAYAVTFLIDGKEADRLRFRVNAPPAQMLGIA